jgi:hypothetical protein
MITEIVLISFCTYLVFGNLIAAKAEELRERAKRERIECDMLDPEFLHHEDEDEKDL